MCYLNTLIWYLFLQLAGEIGLSEEKYHCCNLILKSNLDAKNYGVPWGCIPYNGRCTPHISQAPEVGGHLGKSFPTSPFWENSRRRTGNISLHPIFRETRGDRREFPNVRGTFPQKVRLWVSPLNLT